jgi:enamine deaminase RidA (YjgF/YER057c/UK114 family)
MTYERINPEELGAPRGWTNGMLAPAGGRILFVAGQDAAEPEGKVTTDDFVDQFAIALGKAVTVVRKAGGGPEDIGRMTIFVTSVATYRENRGAVGAVWRARMGKHYPAMALAEVTGLVDPRAQLEIEVTAVICNHAAETAAGSGGGKARGPTAPADPAWPME